MRHLRASRRLTVGIVLSLIAVLAIAGTVIADPFGPTDNAWPYNASSNSPVLAAVGDISCQPGAKQEGEKASDTCDQGTGSTVRDAAQTATADQVESIQPSLVAILGDEQYQNGYYSDFENSYDKYWGAFKFLQRPSPGNHEFYDNHGQTGVRGLGYFDYFNGLTHNADGTEIDQTVTNPTTGHVVSQPTPQANGQAGAFGTTGDGWYSYDLGHWHLVSLNIECKFEPGGCKTTGNGWLAQETQWLQQDLQQNGDRCILAYWHQPTFSATAGAANWKAGSTEGAAADAWWKLLYAAHATLILNGHDHVYSRFAPMDPSGNPDPGGPREFIIGTGGEGLDTVDPATPNLQAYADQYYGVAKFTLEPGGYSWDYESALRDPSFPNAPATYSDSGSGHCQS